MELLLGTIEVKTIFPFLENHFHPSPILIAVSVTWIIEELILEYAGQIEEHMNRISSCIQNNHWRTNPSVLAGLRVAVFRKGNGPIPTVITG